MKFNFVQLQYVIVYSCLIVLFRQNRIYCFVFVLLKQNVNFLMNPTVGWATLQCVIYMNDQF